MQRRLRTHAGRVRVQGRGPLVAIVVCTCVAVAGFCAVVAFAFQH